MSQENKVTSEDSAKKGGIKRRDLLKGLAALPVFGVFIYKFVEKRSLEKDKRQAILEELKDIAMPPESPKTSTVAVKPTAAKPGEFIRLGIIGYGGRGESIVRSAGIAHPEWVENKRKDAEKNKMDTGLQDWLSQENLNIVLNGVCDVFDVRAERGLAASKNETRPGGASRALAGAKRYRHYQDLLASPDIDAVIIGTPDHWHAQMVIDAARAGKHVYCEKAMTRTEEDTHQLYDAVKNSNIVFQLGHQNRQQESHIKAKELIKKEILGKITLVETTTNRNSPNGAWYYDIHEQGSPETIDWDLFQGPAPNKVPFSLERFFRWRCWFDYGTGLAGDLLSHEFDAINQILDLGIPKSAVASGGIYYFTKDWVGNKEYKVTEVRDVPDVFNVVFEYPDRELTLVYSATLASNRDRGKIFMGHDGSMQVGGDLEVYADWDSTRFKEKIKNGVIDTSLPLFTYQRGSKGFDAVTSATEKYFASRGLMYTYREGRRVDTTYLHVKDWLDAIRNGGEPLCNIEQGFQEAITCHMATRSYLEGRKVEWDPIRRRIV
jgi:predicted dehydrogenase